MEKSLAQCFVHIFFLGGGGAGHFLKGTERKITRMEFREVWVLSHPQANVVPDLT